jgi:hypothetical protein
MAGAMAGLPVADLPGNYRLGPPSTYAGGDAIGDLIPPQDVGTAEEFGAPEDPYGNGPPSGRGQPGRWGSGSPAGPVPPGEVGGAPRRSGESLFKRLFGG